MRLTRRGKTVAWSLVLGTSFAVGIFTADWCWYGYCGA